MGTPSPAPINVFCDSDGPIADFDLALNNDGRSAEIFKHEPGVYLWLPITPGAVHALRKLKEYDDAGLLRTWILTKTPSNSPYAYTEKVLWYRRNFPWLEDRVILTHDKHLMGTENDFLLDDRPHKANANKFRGTFTFFDTAKPNKCWQEFVNLVLLRVK
jgi:5'(3')-deoxyribonucleotidase